MNLDEFRRSAKGHVVGQILNSQEAIAAMIATSERGRPAVEAIGSQIAEKARSLTEQERKLVGRWIKDMIAPYGWVPDRRGRVAKGHFFSYGTVYRRTGTVGQISAGERLRRAQSMVAFLPKKVMSADELIAERRAEAAQS